MKSRKNCDAPIVLNMTVWSSRFSDGRFHVAHSVIVQDRPGLTYLLALQYLEWIIIYDVLHELNAVIQGYDYN